MRKRVLRVAPDVKLPVPTIGLAMPGGGGASPAIQVDGTLAVCTDVGSYVASGASRIKAVYIRCETPGTAGNTIVDIHLNGVTIFTVQANRPTLAWNDPDGVAKSGVPNITALAENDVLTVEIDQVATGAEDMVVVIDVDLVVGLVGPAGAVAGAHNLLDGAAHPDTVAQVVSRGSIIFGDGTPNWNELVKGAAGAALLSGALDIAWGTTIDADWLWSTNKKIQFRDPQIFIHSSADGVLHLEADGSITFGASIFPDAPNVLNVGDPDAEIHELFMGDPGAIYWGLTQGVNLYLGAPGVLKTDDHFHCALEVFAGNGLVGSPAYAFIADVDTGMYRIGANDLGFTTNSTLALELNAVQQALITNGTYLAPGLAFITDPDTGLYRVGANRLGFASGGAAAFEIDATQHLIPAAADIHNIGSVAAEILNLYIGDAGRIYFGLAQDVDLYRSAANQLRTHDSFVIDYAAGVGLYVLGGGQNILASLISTDPYCLIDLTDSVAAGRFGVGGALGFIIEYPAGTTGLQIDGAQVLWIGAVKDTSLSRIVANVLGMGVGDAFRAGNYMEIVDGIAAPGANVGFARIYVDTADGDLKVVFGDGFVATIAADS